MPEIQYCDCELRDRLWDPSTHKCQRCGKPYSLSEPFRSAFATSPVKMMKAPHPDGCTCEVCRPVVVKDAGPNTLDNNIRLIGGKLPADFADGIGSTPPAQNFRVMSVEKRTDGTFGPSTTATGTVSFDAPKPKVDNLSKPDDWFADVMEFMYTTGQPVGTLPTTDVPAEILHLRLRLDAEEYNEYNTAFHKRDIVEMTDAAMDLFYVVLGNIITHGIDPRPVWRAIHKANMLKANGPRREDGKVMKPEGWKHPDVAAILADQPALPSHAFIDAKIDDPATHMHMATGNLYWFMFTAYREADTMPMAVYRDSLGQVWTRPLFQFHEVERFTPLYSGAHVPREVEAAKRKSPWRPVSEAPRDTHVLLCRKTKQGGLLIDTAFEADGSAKYSDEWVWVPVPNGV